MLNKLSIKAYCAMQNAKIRFTNFLRKERGGSEIIAVVLVIAIVLVLVLYTIYIFVIRKILKVEL